LVKEVMYQYSAPQNVGVSLLGVAWTFTWHNAKKQPTQKALIQSKNHSSVLLEFTYPMADNKNILSTLTLHH
jgi:hypothetical protein